MTSRSPEPSRELAGETAPTAGATAVARNGVAAMFEAGSRAYGSRVDMNASSTVGGTLLVVVLGTLWVKANVAGLLAPLARLLPW